MLNFLMVRVQKRMEESVIIGQQFVVPAYSKASLLHQPIQLEYADNAIVENESVTTVLDMPNGQSTSKPSDSSQISTLSRYAHGIVEFVDSGNSELDLVGIVVGFSIDSFIVGCKRLGYIWSVCEGGHEEEWRHSIAPIPADKLIDLMDAAQADLDLLTQDGSVLPTSGELIPDSDIVNSDTDDCKEDSVDFEKEVEATFLRAVHENIEQDHVIIDVNSLRYVPYIPVFCKLYHCSLSSSWIEVVIKFEEMCVESTKEFAPLFAQILHLLYDKDILSEDAIISWASEKEGADESDKVFLKQSETFILIRPQALERMKKHELSCNQRTIQRSRPLMEAKRISQLGTPFNQSDQFLKEGWSMAWQMRTFLSTI
ncbi:hypothetical protein IFM89_028828 [Coptis chinensis]|uniref:W2 domain-containing protein n=1 Tax=Coptis chinensis TaxID=261450 RepID=A0A835H7P4_9MAGN|nr:hypothetical protein IFM89_028828 [Coptis chinensis]